MTSYNGQTITYDAIGNPLTYRDGMTMTWKNGRQLATLQTDENSISYNYDSNSVRISKTVNGVKYTYAYINGLLMYETRGDAKFYYSYDANGTLYSVKYTLTDSSNLLTYYYTHNSRGDIVGIYNGAGQLRAHYEYDAWGNVLSVTDQNGNAITSSTHIGNLNPFRYRGYYLDSETGLYYLLSRYYDPVTHRFINTDVYFQSDGDVLDANMSAYCDNNPMNYSDFNGECKIHVNYYKANCTYCSPSYRAHLQTEKGIKLYNKCYGTNYAGVKDNGDFIYASSGYSSASTGVSHAVNTMNTALSTGAGAVSTTATKTFSSALKQSTALSGPLSIASVAIDISLYASNPFLTDGQKWGLSGLSIGFAAAGIGLAALVTCLTPVGWIGIATSIAWGCASVITTTCISSSWSAENEKNWCHRE